MSTKQKAETLTDTLSLDEQRVRVRAYEISRSEAAGTPEANWYRAERELRAEADEAAGHEPAA